jgi:hypothetical protein
VHELSKRCAGAPRACACMRACMHAGTPLLLHAITVTLQDCIRRAVVIHGTTALKNSPQEHP